MTKGKEIKWETIVKEVSFQMLPEVTERLFIFGRGKGSKEQVHNDRKNSKKV